MRDPAFQSQQFMSDVGARRDSYVLQQGQSVMQGLPAVADRIQQGIAFQQKMAMEDAKARSDIALSEVQRQSALEELQWAQALHQTDMIALDKDVKRAQAELAIAQAQKARKGLDTDMSWADYSRMEREDLDYVIANLGKKFLPSQGGVIEADATPEEVAQAKTRLAAADAEKRDLARIRAQASVEAAGIRAGASTEVAKIGAESRKQNADTRQASELLKAAGKLEEAAMDILDLSPAEGSPERKSAEEKLEQARKMREEATGMLRPKGSSATTPTAAPAPPSPADILKTLQQELGGIVQMLNGDGK